MKTDLKTITTQLREAFPNLTDLEIAQLAVSKFEFSTIAGKTVKELIEETRKIYWAEELNRIRAKKGPDGTMRIKDTSTYRTHDLFWKRLEAKFGHLDITELKKNHIIEIANDSQSSAHKTREKRNRNRIEKGLQIGRAHV